MNNYLLEGSDHLTITNIISQIIETEKFNKITISNYDMDIMSLDKALEDLDTYGFFQDKKIVVISNFDNLKFDDNEDSLNHLLKYLKSPFKDNLLFIVCSKIDDRKKIYKDLKKLMSYKKVEINTEKFIREQLSSYKLENGVVNLISDLCQDDISKIYNECLKLKCFKADDGLISKDDVNSLVTKKLSQLNELSFSLIRYMAEKDKRMALKTYNELLEYQFEPLSILGLLESQFRLMYQIKVLSRDGLNNDEIANRLGEKSSYRIKKVGEVTRFYSKDEILDMFIKLADIDFKIKTSIADSTFLLQLFILNM